MVFVDIWTSCKHPMISLHSPHMSSFIGWFLGRNGAKNEDLRQGLVSDRQAPADWFMALSSVPRPWDGRDSQRGSWFCRIHWIHCRSNFKESILPFRKNAHIIYWTDFDIGIWIFDSLSILLQKAFWFFFDDARCILCNLRLIKAPVADTNGSAVASNCCFGLGYILGLWSIDSANGAGALEWVRVRFTGYSQDLQTMSYSF